MLIAAASAPDNTVAVLALVVGAIVGLGSPVLLSLFALRRQTRDLNAEHDRLTTTLAADQRTLRYAHEREVLDGGAALLAKYRTVMTSSQPTQTPGHVLPPEAMYQVLDEIAVQRLRLRLWFEDEDDVVKAFDEILVHTAVWAKERMEPESQSRDAAIKRLDEDVTRQRERYLSAARTQLQGDRP